MALAAAKRRIGCPLIRAWANSAVEMRGRRRRHARGLQAPMLAVIREHPGINHRDALTLLKQERRVSYGTTLADAHDACVLLNGEGLIDGGVYRGWTAVGAGEDRTPLRGHSV